jgi:hypothetical protein
MLMTIEPGTPFPATSATTTPVRPGAGIEEVVVIAADFLRRAVQAGDLVAGICGTLAAGCRPGSRAHLHLFLQAGVLGGAFLRDR